MDHLDSLNCSVYKLRFLVSPIEKGVTVCVNVNPLKVCVSVNYRFFGSQLHSQASSHLAQHSNQQMLRKAFVVELLFCFCL